MKIVFLNSTLGIGGAERQLTVLTTGLFKRGHDVSMAVFHGGYPLERVVRDAGVPLHDLAKSGRYDLRGFLVRLAACLRHERPDVLYSYMMSPNIFGALVKPLVGTKLVWGVQSSNLDPKDFDRAERLFCWLGGVLNETSR